MAMVFNTTFNNISVMSWQSVLLVEETWGPGENYRPVASHYPLPLKTQGKHVLRKGEQFLLHMWHLSYVTLFTILLQTRWQVLNEDITRLLLEKLGRVQNMSVYNFPLVQIHKCLLILQVIWLVLWCLTPLYRWRLFQKRVVHTLILISTFLAHLAKGHVSFRHHLASVVCPSVRPSVRPSYVVNFHILIFTSETTGPIATKLCPVIPTSNQDGRQAKK